jgi:hypothetical protein
MKTIIVNIKLRVNLDKLVSIAIIASVPAAIVGVIVYNVIVHGANLQLLV